MFNTRPLDARTMTDDDLERAVRSFLDETDAAWEEYDRGYRDADATLRALRAEMETLREAVE